MIRRAQDDVPEVHDVFVMNVERHVTGILPLSNLVLARPDESVANIMERPVISVPVEMPQDEVARVLQKYDLVTVPVVDEKGRLAGRVTIDDVVDVIEEEASKDIYAIAGVEGESIDLAQDSVLKRVGERFSWVLTTVVLGLVVALVISKVFVTTFEKMALLAAFLPVIIATAGAVGLQSSTLVVRAIALGTLSFQHILSVIAHEAATGLVLGVSCGLITAVASYSHQHGHPRHPQAVPRRPHRHGHLRHHRRLRRNRAAHHLLQAQTRPRRRRRPSGDGLQRPAGHHAVSGCGDGVAGVAGSSRLPQDKGLRPGTRAPWRRSAAGSRA